MSTSRARCLSCRIPEDVYTRLAERAQAAGVTLSASVAAALSSLAAPPAPAMTGGAALEPPRRPPAGPPPGPDLAAVVRVLVKAAFGEETRVFLDDDIPCPACGRTGELFYAQSEPGPRGEPPSQDLCCLTCHWQVEL